MDRRQVLKVLGLAPLFFPGVVSAFLSPKLVNAEWSYYPAWRQLGDYIEGHIDLQAAWSDGRRSHVAITFPNPEPLLLGPSSIREKLLRMAFDNRSLPGECQARWERKQEGFEG